ASCSIVPGAADAPPGRPDAPVRPDAPIPDAPPPPPPPDAPPPVTVVATHYVLSTLTFGDSIAAATRLGFDLDGDGLTDNVLGRAFAALGSTLDVNGQVQNALFQGAFVVLFSLRSWETGAAWQVYAGDPQFAPDLTSGHGTFTVASWGPTDAILDGTLA